MYLLSIRLLQRTFLKINYFLQKSPLSFSGFYDFPPSSGEDHYPCRSLERSWEQSFGRYWKRKDCFNRNGKKITVIVFRWWIYWWFLSLVYVLNFIIIIIIVFLTKKTCELISTADLIKLFLSTIYLQTLHMNTTNFFLCINSFYNINNLGKTPKHYNIVSNMFKHI